MEGNGGEMRKALWQNRRQWVRMGMKNRGEGEGEINEWERGSGGVAAGPEPARSA